MRGLMSVTSVCQAQTPGKADRRIVIAADSWRRPIRIGKAENPLRRKRKFNEGKFPKPTPGKRHTTRPCVVELSSRMTETHDAMVGSSENNNVSVSTSLRNGLGEWRPVGLTPGCLVSQFSC